MKQGIHPSYHKINVIMTELLVQPHGPVDADQQVQQALPEFWP